MSRSWRTVPSRQSEHRAGDARRPGLRASRLTRRPVVALVVGSVVAGAAAVGGATWALAGAPTTVTLRPGASTVVDSGSSFADGAASAGFTLARRPAGDSLYLGVELRQNGTSLYRSKARVFPDGSVTVDLSRVRGGTESYLAGARIPLTVPAGASQLRVEGQVSGTSRTALRVRAWLNGRTAPDWQLVATDSASPITAAGHGRAWAYLSSSATSPAQLGIGDVSAIPARATATASGPSASVSGAASAPGSSSVPGAPAGQLEGVIASSGADLTVRYPVPSGAVFVSPTGSGSGSGTEDSPLGSIAAAIAKAPRGGTVVLRGGTYRQVAGSVTKPLTIQPYPGERPVLSGADVVTAWTAQDGAWRTTTWTSPFGQDDVRAEEVPSGSAAGKVEQAYRNGTPLRQVLTRAELSAGTFWVDPDTLHAWVGDDPAGATTELSARTRAMTLESGAAGSHLRGLRFTAYAAPHLDNSGQLYVGAADTVIENSQFDHSSGAGLKIAAARITVDHLTVSDNAAEGMQGNRNDKSVVKNSQFLRNNTDNFKVSGCGASCTIAGFKTAHTDGLTVTGNAFLDNAGNGFWCDLGCTNATITGNAVRGGYDGIFYEVSSTGLIAHNYVEKADKGIRISGSDAVTVTDNTLVDNTWQFTVYDDKRSSSTDSYSAALGLSWDTTQLVVRDNVVTAGDRTTLLLASNATDQVANPQMYKDTGSNLVSGNQSMVWCAAVSTCRTYPSIKAWEAASGRTF